MVTIRKRRVGNTDFYYLEHSIKVGKKVEKREKYLGKTIPKNIDEVKRQFLNAIYQEKWYYKLDEIKKNFKREMQKLPEEIREKYMEQFMIKFTYNTNRIEGGSLTLKDTSKLLHENITPSDKPLRDVKEAENHKKVFYMMLKNKKEINLHMILEWHYNLFRDTKPGIAGKIRNYQVAITGTDVELPSPVEITPLLREFFSWYNRNKEKMHTVELAALVHYRFVSIHPFGDGNGRISRLLMNFILHKHGFPMLDISYKNRDSYYTALGRSQKKKQEYIFVQSIIKRYIKDYKKYMKKSDKR
ncbi:MAG: Fic family protein [Candidatus Aenigmarchaeota archaeon]|nr:Fic family protein [Candidatus Aenigmarchaeota archaeon]